MMHISGTIPRLCRDLRASIFLTVPPRYGKRGQSENPSSDLLARIAEPVYRMARVERPTIFAHTETKPATFLTGFCRAVTRATKRLQLACEKFGVVAAMRLDMVGNFGRHDETAL